MEITKASLTRLARRAGVKSISKECYKNFRALLVQRMEIVLQTILLISEERQTKILTTLDVYNALNLMGENITCSEELGTMTIEK
jgi:histone H3/H4